MAAACTQERAIRRVIDEKYPNTRLIWQSFQSAHHPPLSSPPPTVTFTRSVPLTVNPSWEASPPRADPQRDGLGKVIQRLIDVRYPQTRRTWIRSREEPDSVQARPPGLPGLTAANDARRPITAL
jgi:hypothetical protein